MPIHDEIFPSDRRPAYVQTEWSGGWTYARVGYDEAARFLTENRRSFGATIDQVGLVIFFLQRHRVELALKELLVTQRVDLGELRSAHSLAVLWAATSRAVGPDTEAWHGDRHGGELVALLNEADPGSYSYRYPVDKQGVTHERPEYIDLDELERHVGDLCSLIDGYMTYVAEAEEAEREYGPDAWP